MPTNLRAKRQSRLHIFGSNRRIVSSLPTPACAGESDERPGGVRRKRFETLLQKRRIPGTKPCNALRSLDIAIRRSVLML